MQDFPTVDIKNLVSEKPKGLKEWVQRINKYIYNADHLHPGRKLSEIEAEIYSHSQIFDAFTILLVSDPKGNIIFVNDKFCEVSKYSVEELIGKPHNIAHHLDMPDSLLKEMWGMVKMGKVWHGEVKSKAKDGMPYWMLATVAPVMDDNGKPIKYISMCVDITHQKEAEHELKHSRRNIDLDLFQNINYAKHVHDAFLTTEDDLNRLFTESFLIYKARNIISGDFYRVYRKGDESIIVFGDSTGHGVSASYISLLVLNILDRILKEGLSTPSEILRIMHKEISHVIHLNKKINIIESADTMVCRFNHRTKMLNYSSAKMKGVIIRKGEIIELKKDRCSIGELSDKPLYITSYEIPLQEGDCLYLFSDGITDQFGGMYNKKFSYKNLLHVLNENYLLPMQRQKSNISEILSTWQGSHDQTDDMTLLGIEIRNDIQEDVFE